MIWRSRIERARRSMRVTTSVSPGWMKSRSRSLRRSEEVLSRCALHSSRCPYMHVRAVWAYLRNGGDLEVAARIAGHESTRTTQLYNRLHEEISLDEIERIHI